MIGLEDCKDRHLYRIRSRSIGFYGVYLAEHKGFIGVRHKFGVRYLFVEHHYDTGAPYGTVEAEEDLGRCYIQIPVSKHPGDIQSCPELQTWMESR